MSTMDTELFNSCMKGDVDEVVQAFCILGASLIMEEERCGVVDD